jgi:hypothetical protein
VARLPGGIGPGIYNSTGFEHRVPVHMSFLFLAGLIIALHLTLQTCQFLFPLLLVNLLLTMSQCVHLVHFCEHKCIATNFVCCHGRKRHRKRLRHFWSVL